MIRRNACAPLPSGPRSRRWIARDTRAGPYMARAPRTSSSGRRRRETAPRCPATPPTPVGPRTGEGAAAVNLSIGKATRSGRVSWIRGPTEALVRPCQGHLVTQAGRVRVRASARGGEVIYATHSRRAEAAAVLTSGRASAQFESLAALSPPRSAAGVAQRRHWLSSTSQRVGGGRRGEAGGALADGPARRGSRRVMGPAVRPLC